MTEQILNCIGDCRVAWATLGACIGLIVGSIIGVTIAERKKK